MKVAINVARFSASLPTFPAEEHLSATASAWLLAGCAQRGEIFRWGALSDIGRVPIFRGVATGDGFQLGAETRGDFFFTQGCLTGENAGENFLPAC